MNFIRIYQGRVKSLSEVLSEKKTNIEIGENLGLDPLTRFNALFSDAINYNLLAIGAMVRGSDEERLKNFVQRVKESWRSYFKRGRYYEGLCAGFVRSMALDSEPTFEEALDLIVANPNEEISPEILQLAGESLLLDLGGDGTIQHGSKTYLPLFCGANTTANFPRGPVNLLKAEGKVIAPSIIWADESPVAILEKLHYEYFANPNTSGTLYKGKEARKRLTEALEAEEKHEPFPPKLFSSLKALIDDLSDALSFRRYTGGSVSPEPLLRRFNVYLLLNYVSPDPELLTRLRSLIKEPKKSVLSHQLSDTEVRLTALGDDPIKLARGARGFVFPAFSALPIWKDAQPGEFTFKGFDIQAFAEALKTISQFQTKTVERAAERAIEKSRIDWMRGDSDVPPEKEEGKDEVLPQLGGDIRFERLEKILAGYVDEDGQELTVRTLRERGFRRYDKVREHWLKIAKSEDLPIDLKALEKAIAKVQQDQPRLIGDTTLFNALAKPENQIIWQPPQDDVEGRPHDVVKATLRLSQFERKHQKLSDPVKLSPAHPVLSRRQFHFSDLTGSSKEKISFEKIDDQHAIVSIASEARGRSEGWAEHRVRLDFNAPRIQRDGLSAGTNADWLQPMMKALGAEMEKPTYQKVAIALMLEQRGEETIHLLNFPLTLEFKGKKEAGLQRVNWKRQLNGTADKKLHVHDPKTLEKDSKITPWFLQPEVQKNGLHILGVDLGQRIAASCALIELNGERTMTKAKKGRLSEPIPAIELGLPRLAKGVSQARVFSIPSVRLPGEDQRLLTDGEWKPEPYGSRGRFSTKEEYEEALKIEALYASDAGSWIGTTAKENTFPEQNDQLIKILRKLMTRRRALYRYSWQCAQDEASLRERLAAQYERSLKELAADSSLGLGQLLEAIRARYQELGSQIQDVIERLGNRVLPISKHRWQWLPHSQECFREKGWHELILQSAPSQIYLIKFQRGLSMRRLEQVTAFRKCLLSFNRSCLEEFGVEPLKGEACREESTPEPCPSILKRLDELRDQRIKQTAHGIIQLALGLRLTQKDQSHSSDIVHGIYEKTPGRRPVDLIVLENLQRYRASQGRGKYENSSLMQWCHRAILDKVKEMAEPFGLQVIEVQPDYSSRFHALTGAVGFRADRVSATEAKGDWARHLVDEMALSKLTDQRKYLRQIYLKHQEAVEEKKALSALYCPKDGGTDFIGMVREKGTLKPLPSHQADLNAAANLALSAVAAPTAFNVFRKIRLEKKGKKIVLVRSNKRENAAFSKAHIVSGEALTQKAHQNAFFDLGQVASSGQLDYEGRTQPLVTSLALFKTVKDWRWEMCRILNNQILAKAGLKGFPQTTLPNKSQLTDYRDEEDDIVL